MTKMMVIISLSFALCIPKTSFSQNEMTKGSQEWNKLEISNIRNQLRGNGKKLSLLKKDLKVMYTSMDSFHAEERFLIIHCRENIERIEGVYTYVADMLEQYLIMKKDKMPYYSYLEEYGIQHRMDGFAGMLVEEMASGMELMAGAKVDYQFGPVILLGMGGTGVEIYQDTTLRMAPLAEKDVTSMVKNLKAHQLLEGYRGAKPINLRELIRTLMAFSRLVMDIQEHIESVDLNPLYPCAFNNPLSLAYRICHTRLAHP